jgi:hypothetical protein
MHHEERQQGLTIALRNNHSNTDERRERMRQLANVCIEMFLEQRDRIAESPAELAEAA